MAKRRILEYCLAVDVQKVCYLSPGTHDVFLLDNLIQQRIQIVEPLRIVRIGTQDIQLTETPVGYGKRKWFICPGCSTNTRKLFLNESCTKWLCRQCNNLTYLSSNVNKNAQRKLKIAIEKQQQELHVTAKNGYPLASFIPLHAALFKPLYMQQSTFDTKRTRLDLMIITLAEMRLIKLKADFKKHYGKL